MPDFKNEIREQLAGLDLSAGREGEIVEELSQHLEEEYERALREGATADEARAKVLSDLRAPDRLAGELRRVESRVRHEPIVAGALKNGNLLADVIQDLRYGLRTLIKNPGFTLIAILALALGIGANSAIFSVVNAILLRPLPYAHPDQLVIVWEEAARYGFPKNTPSPANFIDWRSQNTVFEAMAATAESSFNLTGVGEPERFDGHLVSANLFSLLGVEARLGRTFTSEEDKPGTHVVVLSDGIWKRRFGSNPAMVGQAIVLNGQSYTVVGVMPPGFEFPSRRDRLWVPIAFDAKEAAKRGSHYLEVVARLKPNMTVQQAQSEMSTIAARLAQQYPEDNKSVGATVTPLQEQVVGNIKPALLVLLAAVGFVLLIACANVANLLLARAAVRQKEIALRLALGASRSRLTRQFLTESVLLATLGGAVGLILSIAGVRILKLYIPDTIAQAQTVGIDGRVLAFTAAVAVLTGLIFGLAPATQASNFNLNDTLKEGGRDSGGGSKGHRLRSLLVITEVAVSFILLIGAGLLINSFIHLRNLDPGFRADHLLAMKIPLSETKYPDKEHRTPFYDEVIRRVRALPGVQAAAVAGNLPLTYDGDSGPIGIEGVVDPPPDQRPDVIMRVVGPDYFRTMGIPMVAGRDFSEHDKADATLAVIISEKTARHFWPGQDPLGKRLKPGSATSQSPWREVVGVVKDVRQNDFVAEPKMGIYFAYPQLNAFPPNAVVVRTNVDPLSLAVPVRNAIWAVDKDQPVSEIRTMEEIVSEAVARQRFSMWLLGIFAGLALLLAAVGIYGVMSYSVAQRTREIGIRMALGAQRSDVLKMTVGQGLKLVLTGVVIGLIVAVVLTRVMASLLFGVSATDPVTFVSIAVVLVAVAVLASYLPALRATRIDPMLALRAQ